MTERRIRIQLSEPAMAILDKETAKHQQGDVISSALLAYADNNELRAVAEHLRETAEIAIADRDAWKARYEVLEAALLTQARFAASVGAAINKNATISAMERVARYNEEDEVSDDDLGYFSEQAQDPEYNKSWDELVSESVKVIRG